MPFLKNFVKAAKNVSEVAAPIVAGALGGPVAAQATKQVIGKLDSSKHAAAPASFTPSTAGDVSEARSGDRSRMKRQYGM
jgi:hypothetical protein